MKNYLLNSLLLVCNTIAFTQNLPKNQELGKCYVKSKTPEVWKNETIAIQTAPKHKKIIVHPAEYKTVIEKVLIKEIGIQIIAIPAVWEDRNVNYIVKEASTMHSIVDASFKQDFKTIEVKAVSAKWEMSEIAPSCKSSNPDDCRYWCYKPVDAQHVTIPITKLNKETELVSNKIASNQKTYIKKVMITPPTTRKIKIPAIYKNIKRTVLIKDAWKEEVIVAAKHKKIIKKVLIDKGGLKTWKEIDCELVKNTLLPINWNIGNSELTSEAKKILT